MAKSTGATDPAFDRIFCEMMDQPTRYAPLFMSLPGTQKEEFEDQVLAFTSNLLDATSPSFQAVFPPVVMAQGQHLILVMISQRPMLDPAHVYRSIGQGASRRLIFGVDNERLARFDDLIKSYMTVPETRAFEHWSQREPLFLPPKAGAFGVLALRGLRPESDPD